MLVLRDLETRWEIGVEVVLSVEVAGRVHRASERRTHAYSFFDDSLVRYRKSPREAHTHGTHDGICLFAPCIVVAGTEHFGLRADLRVDFEADDCFEFHDGQYEVSGSQYLVLRMREKATTYIVLAHIFSFMILYSTRLISTMCVFPALLSIAYSRLTINLTFR